MPYLGIIPLGRKTGIEKLTEDYFWTIRKDDFIYLLAVPFLSSPDCMNAQEDPLLNWVYSDIFNAWKNFDSKA